MRPTFQPARSSVQVSAVVRRPNSTERPSARRLRAASRTPWQIAATGAPAAKIPPQASATLRSRDIRACRVRDARPEEAGRQNLRAGLAATALAPDRRGLQALPESRVGRPHWPASAGRMTTKCFNPGRKPQRSSPSPVIIMSSARPGCPSGVAKVTEWPSRLSTLQLTATSLGSKSLAGIGMRPLAIAFSPGARHGLALRRLFPAPHHRLGEARRSHRMRSKTTAKRRSR